MRITLFLTFLALSNWCFSQEQRQLIYPEIEGYGGIYPLKESILPDKTNKVIIDVTMGAEEPGALVKAYDRVARLINLYHFSGSKKGDLKLAIITHGAATYSVLDNDSYQKQFGVDNPNLVIIKKLKAYGVQIMVCGQALIKRGYVQENLNDNIDLALSAITTLTDFQKKGFTLLYY
jgi:intracellular sulfur oxidation DsrE/DsrF family protein